MAPYRLPPTAAPDEVPSERAPHLAGAKIVAALYSALATVFLVVLGFDPRTFVVMSGVALLGGAQVAGHLWLHFYPRWRARQVARQVARVMSDGRS